MKGYSWDPGVQDQREQEAWFQKLPRTVRQWYRAQDQDRINAHREVLVGTMTRESFVDLCIKQARENLGRIKRMPRGPDPHDDE